MQLFSSYQQRYTFYGVTMGMCLPFITMAMYQAFTGLPFFAPQFDDPAMWVVDTAPLVLGIISALAGRNFDID
jgi:hypothetical protein